MQYSTKLFERAQTVIPGGVNSPVRAFKGVGGTPLFFKKGQGPYVYDVDNQRYIDYVSSWGPLILGHAHPKVLEATQHALTQGFGFGAPTEIEVEMAEFIHHCMPSIEQIRMVSSGTEATQSAIRLARGFTGRTQIVKFEACYHGHSDGLLVQAGSGVLTCSIPGSPGVPAEIARCTQVVPFNDLEAVRALFQQSGQNIAAILVEPIAANMSCILPVPGFLEGLRALCDEYGALLIFDEVITGFRVGLGGAQALYQVKPDLTCLGKIIGGGLPVGAFGGRKDIMAYLAPEGPVYQAGTLSGNPIALTAGLTTLKELKAPGFYENLSTITQYFAHNLEALAKAHGVALKTCSVGGILGLYFTKDALPTRYSEVLNSNLEDFKKFFHGMLGKGVYFAPSAFEVGFVSSAHTQAIVDETLEAAVAVFKDWD